jgi:hypothetical protein
MVKHYGQHTIPGQVIKKKKKPSSKQNYLGFPVI